MSDKTYEIIFSSEIYKVKDIIRGINNFLLLHMPNIGSNDMFELRLIFSELLCNAVIHGNKHDKDKKVHLRIELLAHKVSAVISDEGSGFDYKRLLSQTNSIESVSKESGRGILLVYSLTDSLAFNITGNEITFYKRVNY